MHYLCAVVRRGARRLRISRRNACVPLGRATRAIFAYARLPLSPTARLDAADGLARRIISFPTRMRFLFRTASLPLYRRAHHSYNIYLPHARVPLRLVVTVMLLATCAYTLHARTRCRTCAAPHATRHQHTRISRCFPLARTPPRSHTRHVYTVYITPHAPRYLSCRTPYRRLHTPATPRRARAAHAYLYPAV